MTVKQMLARMDSFELTEWMAYSEVEPFGAERDNLHAAIVASTIANVNRGKNSKSFSPQEFMLHTEKPKEPDVDSQIAHMQVFAAAVNAQVGT